MNRNAGKFISPQRSPVDAKENQNHVERLKEATGIIDSSPPSIPLSLYNNAGKYFDYLQRLKKIEEENRTLLQHLNVINRTKGRIDNEEPSGLHSTNYFNRLRENRKIEKKNKDFYNDLQDIVSRYQKKEQLKFYKDAMQKMIFMSKHPEYYEQSLRDPLEQWSICPPPSAQPPEHDPSKRVRCFFDVEVENEFNLGRMIFEIYKGYAPMAGENFIQLCKNKEGLTYKKSIFHRVVPGLVCMGGDIEYGTGNGGKSIYGKTFKDEKKILRFAGPGVISTYNFEPGMNNSQFLISFKEMSTLNNRFVVFGRVILTLRTLYMIEEFGTKIGRPKKRIVVTNCGVIGKTSESKTF